MENASKALLIAAAVLIVIALVSIGIALVRNASDTSKQADIVQKEISLATDEAIRDYQKCFITAEEFNDFLNYFNTDKRSSNEFRDIITKEQNKKIRKQIQLIGYAYLGKDWLAEREMFFKENKCTTQEEKSKFLIEEGYKILTSKNLLIPVEDPLIESHKEYFRKIYTKVSGYEAYETLDDTTKNKIEKDYQEDKADGKIPGYAEWFWTYDTEGYVNRACYITHIKFSNSWKTKK